MFCLVCDCLAPRACCCLVGGKQWRHTRAPLAPPTQLVQPAPLPSHAVQIWQEGTVSSKNDVPTWLLAIGGFAMVLGLATCECRCCRGGARHNRRMRESMRRNRIPPCYVVPAAPRPRPSPAPSAARTPLCPQTATA